MADEQTYPEPAIFTAAAAVFARRDGQILILKRAGGALTGAWYIPGGAVDEGEDPEEAALRELKEEAGLVPNTPLVLIGVCPMHVYDRHSLQFVYAADCDEGEVVISHEHEGFRWVDPVYYRDRYFSDESLSRLKANSGERSIVASVRKNLDDYLVWLVDQEWMSKRPTG